MSRTTPCDTDIGHVLEKTDHHPWAKQHQILSNTMMISWDFEKFRFSRLPRIRELFGPDFFASELKLFNPDHFFTRANHGTYFLLDKNGLKGPKLLQNLDLAMLSYFSLPSDWEGFRRSSLHILVEDKILHRFKSGTTIWNPSYAE